MLVLLVLPSPVRARSGRRPLRRGGRGRVLPAGRSWLRGARGGPLGSRACATVAATSATGCWLAACLAGHPAASTVVVVGHVLTFLVAARAAGSTPRRSSCCRWRCWCCWRWRCRRTSPAGVRARAWPPGRSARPGWARPGRGHGRGVRRAGRCVASLPGAVVLTRAPPASAAAAGRRGGGAVAERPYTLLSCGMSIDGYLDRGDRATADALQRRRPRPGRRRARRLRRDPGRRRHRPQRQPAAAGARSRPRADGARPRGLRRRRSR